jgi:zinc transport system ATP-binding protein
MNGAMLKVKNLSVDLAGEKIIQDLNFEVKENETLILLGPNGAGKTVLLRALLGFVPFKGEISWRKGVRISYVPQRVPLVRDFPLSLEDFFGLKKVSKERAKEYLGLVGMGDDSFLQKRIDNLSSGQFQRVLIAWGLVGNPQVLLFDEPTAGIDLGGEETIYSLLAKLKKEKGLTVILVTHDLSLVYKEADNVLCFNKKMFCQGKPREILTAQNLSELFGGEMSFYSHHHE